VKQTVDFNVLNYCDVILQSIGFNLCCKALLDNW